MTETYIKAGTDCWKVGAAPGGKNLKFVATVDIRVEVTKRSRTSFIAEDDDGNIYLVPQVL